MIYEFTQKPKSAASYMGIPMTSLAEHKIAEHKIAVDLLRVEAVQQDDGWTCIVTGTDTYCVTEPYAIVLAAWLRARREA